MATQVYDLYNDDDIPTIDTNGLSLLEPGAAAVVAMITQYSLEKLGQQSSKSFLIKLAANPFVGGVVGATVIETLQFTLTRLDDDPENDYQVTVGGVAVSISASVLASHIASRLVLAQPSLLIGASVVAAGAAAAVTIGLTNHGQELVGDLYGVANVHAKLEFNGESSQGMIIAGSFDAGVSERLYAHQLVQNLEFYLGGGQIVFYRYDDNALGLSAEEIGEVQYNVYDARIFQKLDDIQENVNFSSVIAANDGTGRANHLDYSETKDGHGHLLFASNAAEEINVAIRMSGEVTEYKAYGVYEGSSFDESNREFGLESGTGAGFSLLYSNSGNYLAGDAYANILVGSNDADTFEANGGNDIVLAGDGNDTILGEGGDDTLIGGLGNDQISGGADSDLILGGGGNDTLTGGTDADMFQFEFQASGLDTVTDFELGSDALNLRDFGLLKSDLQGIAEQIGNDTILHVTGSYDIKLLNINKNDLLNPTNDAFFGLVDGTSGNYVDGTSSGQWIDQYFTDVDGDKVSAGDDTIEGNGGNDVLAGLAGSDTYIWKKGDGNDSINEVASVTEANRLIMEGVIAEEVYFRSSGNTLSIFMRDGSSINYITVNNQWADTGSGFELDFLKVDDTTFNLTGGLFYRGSSTTGTEALHAAENYAANDVFDGGTGNDHMNGYGGSDTYIVQKGDGIDFIYETITSTDEDVLKLEGISNDEVYLNNISGDLEVKVIDENGVQQNIVYISNQWDDTANGFAMKYLQVGGGYMDLTGGLLFRGTQFGNTLRASEIYSANDTFDGGMGNDTYYGYGGNDTYIWRAGEGSDTIYDSDGETHIQMIGIPHARLQTVEQEGSTIYNLMDEEMENVIQRLVHVHSDNESLRVDYGVDKNAISRGTGNDVLQDIVGQTTLRGGGGDDEFVFTQRAGTSDEITDFTISEDTIDLSAFSRIYSLNDIAMSDDNGTAVLDLGDGQTLRLVGVNYTQLGSGDFEFSTSASNYAPVAVADSYTLDEGETYNGASVLANDTDAESDDLEAILVSGVSHGTLSLNADGTFTYVHDGSENLSDSFTYKADDGIGGGNTVTVSLTMNQVNDAPVATEDGYTLAKGATLTIAAGLGVLANDLDAEGAALAAMLVDDVDHGTLVLNADGSFEYIHDNSANLADSFTYKVNDGTVDGNTVTVSFTMEAFNVVNGTSGDDVLSGTASVDSISGGDGNDDLEGGAEGDYIAGGNGADTIAGEAGNDTLEGGAGADVFVFSPEAGATDDIVDFAIGTDSIDISAFGDLYGLTDLVLSDAGGDAMVTLPNGQQIRLQNVDYTQLTAGDFVFAELPYTIINGTAGADSLSGTADEDSISGGDGDDDIAAAQGADTIDGGSGADTIDGGNGNDLLEGGVGADTFIFTAEANAEDVISDFVHGTDTIDISAIDGLYGLEDVNMSDDGGDAIISLGNGQVIRLAGVSYASLTADDFVFTPLVYNTVNGTSGADTLTGSSGIDSITGGDGNDIVDAQGASDIVAGGNGDDSLYGGQGNDSLDGGADDDTIEGGLGDDLLAGGSGADTFVFKSHANATDIISDFAVGVDTIDLTAIAGVYGIDDIAISGDSGDALITLANNQVIRMSGMNYTSLTAGDFLFDSQPSYNVITGTSAAQVMNGTSGADYILGMGGNDYIYASGSTDVLVGGAGNDSLYGGAGNDIYLWSAGDGNDVVDEAASGSAADKIVMTGDITASDVEIYGSTGNDLVIELTATGETIRIVDGMHQNSNDHVETLEFDDASTINLYQAWEFRGGAENDYLYGSEFNDTMNGGGDNDSLYGGTGNDTYLWSAGDGDDAIDEANSGSAADILHLTGGITASDVEIYGSTGNDLVVELISTGETIRIVDGMGSDSDDHVETLLFDDNTTIDLYQAWEFRGGINNDYLYGSSFNDTMNGGAGNDSLYGGAGNDTYLWSIGNGNDVINEENFGSAADVLHLTGGFTSSDVEIYGSTGNDLVIELTATGETIRITDGMSDDADYHVETLLFDDTSTINLWQAREFRGTTGNDYLYGTAAFADTLIGGIGNDNLYGGAGNDTYRWAEGDGNDVINESNSGSTADVLHLTGGITASDVEIYGSTGNDLVIELTATGEMIRITDGMSDDADYHIETLLFDDTSTINLWQAWEFRGTTGNDYLYGTAAFADTLIGGIGNDNLYGGAGNDTYRWAEGDGNDVINESNSGSTADVLHLTGGITASDVEIYGSTGNDLVVELTATGETIRITDGMGADSDYHVESLIFDDSTSINLYQAREFRGTAGNDYLYDSEFNDTLTGGAGNDNLYGSYGDDTFVWGAGDGNDYISESSTSGSTNDILRLTGGVELSDLSFSAGSSWDLIITHTPTNETLTINNHYYGDSDYLIETIVFDDSSTFDLTSIV